MLLAVIWQTFRVFTRILITKEFLDEHRDVKWTVRTVQRINPSPFWMDNSLDIKIF